jgi:hypothetical protein
LSKVTVGARLGDGAVVVLGEEGRVVSVGGTVGETESESQDANIETIKYGNAETKRDLATIPSGFEEPAGSPATLRRTGVDPSNRSPADRLE